MTAKWFAIALLPLLAGCGYAFGQGVGVYEDDRYVYDDGYRAHEYEYDRHADRGVSFRKLPLPRGHLPRPGRCRVWLPGVPPGHQPPSGSCARLRHRVPPGAWLVIRPHERPGLVELRVSDRYDRGAWYRYVYDARSGRRF